MIRILILLVVTSVSLYAQNPSLKDKLISRDLHSSIITDSIKTKFNIDYTIYRIYSYDDDSGKHYVVLTHNIIKCLPTQREGHCTDKIKAYCFLAKQKGIELKYSFKDFINLKQTDASEEWSIGYWPKYLYLDDVDNDGNVDPIFVYGTSTINYTDDGRIKILIFYKGNKRSIRHQNGVLDFQRHTQVDKTFYELPNSIQTKVKSIMEDITENHLGIFPYGWQDAMKNKALKFDEN